MWLFKLQVEGGGGLNMEINLSGNQQSNKIISI